MTKLTRSDHSVSRWSLVPLCPRTRRPLWERENSPYLPRPFKKGEVSGWENVLLLEPIHQFFLSTFRHRQLFPDNFTGSDTSSLYSLLQSSDENMATYDSANSSDMEKVRRSARMTFGLTFSDPSKFNLPSLYRRRRRSPNFRTRFGCRMFLWRRKSSLDTRWVLFSYSPSKG